MRGYLGLLLIAVFTVAGCSDDDAAGPSASIEGTYTLRTINGSPLPFVLEEEAGLKAEVLSSTLTLQPSGTFTQLARVRVTFGGSATTEEQASTGTYTQSGNNITLTETFEGEVSTFAGVWNGSNQLTFTDDGFILVYQK